MSNYTRIQGWTFRRTSEQYIDVSPPNEDGKPQESEAIDVINCVGYPWGSKQVPHTREALRKEGYIWLSENHPEVLMTPKQRLIAHLNERHAGAHRRNGPRAKRPESMSLRELQDLHALQHYRYTPDHVHWDGTDADRNIGATNRPKGWKTGEDVREITKRRAV